MGAIDLGTLINTIINAGVAGVFAVFGVVLIREVTDFLEKNNTMWTNFLEQERVQRTTMWTRVDDSVNNLETAVQSLRDEVGKNNSIAKENVEATRELTLVLRNGTEKSEGVKDGDN